MEIVQTEAFQRSLKGLRDITAQARVIVAAQRMASENLGDCKSLGGGLFESRIHCGPGYRIYFVRQSEDLIVLLLCGDKSGQKSDIQRAKILQANA